MQRRLVVRTDIFDFESLFAVCVKMKPVVVILDGVYLLARSKKHEDQSALLKNLKEMQSKETSPVKGIPIVIFSQLNKNNEVGFADSYKQDSNVVINFERIPAKAQAKNSTDKEMLTNQLEFTSEKVRRGKEFYKIPVWFNEATSSFENGDMPTSVVAADNKRRIEKDEVPVQKVNLSPGVKVDSLFNDVF